MTVNDVAGLQQERMTSIPIVTNAVTAILSNVLKDMDSSPFYRKLRLSVE